VLNQITKRKEKEQKDILGVNINNIINNKNSFEESEAKNCFYYYLVSEIFECV